MDAAAIMNPVLKGVVHLNKHKMIHRDLKAGSLLSENKANDALIRIVDFGLTAHCDVQGKIRGRSAHEARAAFFT